MVATIVYRETTGSMKINHVPFVFIARTASFINIIPLSRDSFLLCSFGAVVLSTMEALQANEFSLGRSESDWLASLVLHNSSISPVGTLIDCSLTVVCICDVSYICFLFRYEW